MRSDGWVADEYGEILTMSKQRKKDPPAPKSGNWRNYKPDDDLYWRLGGPFVPIEKIPPAEYRYHEIGTGYKASSRIKYILDVIRMSEEDMERCSTYYLKLNELGIDAMELEFYRKQDRELDAQPGNWTMVARNVDRHRASSYRSIRMNLTKLAAYRRQLAELEKKTSPLLAGLD